MILVLFIMLVIILGILIIISGVKAHIDPGRHTAGWWAGLLLAVLLLGYSHSQFSSLPTKQLMFKLDVQLILKQKSTGKRLLPKRLLLNGRL